MDRVINYASQIPLETDVLSTNRFALIGLAKLAEAVLGTSTKVSGLPCTPTSPASLSVSVGPGQIFDLDNIDSTAYSSLSADTAHQILKQGILLDSATLSCPAPAGSGNSINYLVQAAFSEEDGGSQVLPYYNPSNPTQGWLGPNNSGVSNFTLRQDKCVVAVKAGAEAATGSQTTPAADSGYVGLYVVTVAYGQTTITSGDIAVAANAPFLTVWRNDNFTPADYLTIAAAAADYLTKTDAAADYLPLHDTADNAAKFGNQLPSFYLWANSQSYVRGATVSTPTWSASTTYTNSSGQPMMMSLWGHETVGANPGSIAIYVDGQVVAENGSYGSNTVVGVTALVPAGSTFEYTLNSVAIDGMRMTQ